MTAVTDAALARLKASIQKSSSMKLSLAGNPVPWTRYTSRPLTFSSTRTKRFPSEKRSVSLAPSGQSRYSAMARPNLGLADPAKRSSSSDMRPTYLLDRGLLLVVRDAKEPLGGIGVCCPPDDETQSR